MWDALREAVQDYIDNASHPDLTWKMLTRDEDFDDLPPAMFFNHFENREAMTTKIGLLQTLRDQPSARGFFPMCYDASKSSEREAFVTAFRRYAALRIVQQHLLLSAADGPPEYRCCPNMVEIAAHTLQEWVSELVPARLRPMTRLLSVTASEWQALLEYSVLASAQLCADGPASYDWGAYPPEARTFLEKLVHKIEVINPQASLQQGRNVWIAKPHANSKAHDTECLHTLPDIARHCAVTTEDCILQKYIERPLLLDNRKFDIRQWVLVRSASPLKVFMFSDCYLRLCDKEYDMGDLANRQSHLSNFQVNEGGDAMSLAEFRGRLTQMTGKSDVWETVVQPQLEAIVLATCKAARSSFVQRERSFELCGFDLMLDADLRLWLLEVNANPDCRHQAPYLERMLQRMTRRLLEVACLGKEKPDGEEYDWLLLASESASGAPSF